MHLERLFRELILHALTHHLLYFVKWLEARCDESEARASDRVGARIKKNHDSVRVDTFWVVPEIQTGNCGEHQRVVEARGKVAQISTDWGFGVTLGCVKTGGCYELAESLMTWPICFYRGCRRQYLAQHK